MFWEDVDPILTPRLEEAIAAAYERFARYKLSGTITYCNCPVCMTDEVAGQLSTQPLKDISAPILAEYTNSAHGYDREIIEPEFKYFLPRYLDLIAQCDPPSHLGLETCLTRLDGYRDNWPREEVNAVDEFFDAFAGASVYHLYLLEWPVGYRLEFDMGELLGMVILAGGDLPRVLDVLDTCPDPYAAVHMASMRLDLRTINGVPSFENAHLESHPTATKLLGEWVTRDSVTDRIIAAHDELQDPDYDDILNLAVSYRV